MSQVTGHTTMFRLCGDYGEPMEDDRYSANFYFAIETEDSRLSAYVTRAEFNWLAERLGTPPLTDEDVSK